MISTNAIEFNKELGRLIRATRQKHGFSQTDLARRMGISFQQLQKYEVGDNAIPFYRLHQISQIFEISFASYIDAHPNQSDYRILDQDRIDALLSSAQTALQDLKKELIRK